MCETRYTFPVNISLYQGFFKVVETYFAAHAFILIDMHLNEVGKMNGPLGMKAPFFPKFKKKKKITYEI